MKIIRIECIAENGFHARPAALIAKCAKEYVSRTFLINDENGKRADARSVTSVMTLGVKKGTNVCIESSGADENEAAMAMAELIARIDK